MENLTTILMSLDLLKVPSRVRLMRSAPLPAGTETLLRIAGGDEELTQRASMATGELAAVVREAASFFIEQAMLFPDADSYRVLGASPKATSSDLRRNMSLLLSWLHPDRSTSERSVFAHRVTRAWNDLKTDERRLAYDRKQASALAQKSLARKRDRSNATSHWPERRTRSLGSHAIPVLAARTHQPSGLFRKMLLFILGREVT
jgi:hypothetical protein